MHRILLVEDSEDTQMLVSQILGSTFSLSCACDLARARTLLDQEEYDLVLLDVSLPDGDGFHFFSMLQNDSKFQSLAIIFLTAKDSLSDKVLGLSLGAEDYVVKPFQPEELKVRVEMRLKKLTDKKTQEKIIKKGNLEIHLEAQRAFDTSASRTDLQLTPLEFKLLVFLLTHEDQIFSRDQLINQAWSENTHLTDRVIDTHIYALRKKLGPHSAYIQSVYGQGYRFLLPTETSKKRAA